LFPNADTGRAHGRSAQVKFDSSASWSAMALASARSRQAAAEKTMIASAWRLLSPDETLPDRREASDGHLGLAERSALAFSIPRDSYYLNYSWRTSGQTTGCCFAAPRATWSRARRCGSPTLQCLRRERYQNGGSLSGLTHTTESTSRRKSAGISAAAGSSASYATRRPAPRRSQGGR